MSSFGGKLFGALNQTIGQFGSGQWKPGAFFSNLFSSFQPQGGNTAATPTNTTGSPSSPAAGAAASSAASGQPKTNITRRSTHRPDPTTAMGPNQVYYTPLNIEPNVDPSHPSGGGGSTPMTNPFELSRDAAAGAAGAAADPAPAATPPPSTDPFEQSVTNLGTNVDFAGAGYGYTPNYTINDEVFGGLGVLYDSNGNLRPNAAEILERIVGEDNQGLPFGLTSPDGSVKIPVRTNPDGSVEFVGWDDPGLFQSGPTEQQYTQQMADVIGESITGLEEHIGSAWGGDAFTSESRGMLDDLNKFIEDLNVGGTLDPEQMELLGGYGETLAGTPIGSGISEFLESYEGSATFLPGENVTFEDPDINWSDVYGDSINSAYFGDDGLIGAPGENPGGFDPNKFIGALSELFAGFQPQGMNFGLPQASNQGLDASTIAALFAAMGSGGGGNVDVVGNEPGTLGPNIQPAMASHRTLSG